jgi:hypothetical protein
MTKTGTITNIPKDFRKTFPATNQKDRLQLVTMYTYELTNQINVAPTEFALLRDIPVTSFASAMSPQLRCGFRMLDTTRLVLKICESASRVSVYEKTGVG